MLDPKEIAYVGEVFNKMEPSTFEMNDQLTYLTLVNDLVEFQKEMIAKYAHERPVKFLIKL